MPKLDVEKLIEIPEIGIKLIPPFTLVWENENSDKVTMSCSTNTGRFYTKNIELNGKMKAKRFIELVKQC